MQYQRYRSGVNSNSGEDNQGLFNMMDTQDDDVNMNNNRGPRLVKQMQLTSSAELESS